MGVVATVDKIKCPETLKTVYQFDVTGRLPIRLKKLTKADRKRDLLATVDRIEPWCSDFATAELDRLKTQINNL